jgi:hypothetical protein
MRCLKILWLCIFLLPAITAGADENVQRWKTYRSEKYGYELSCMNEEYPFEDDDATDAESVPVTADVEPVITFIGIKGPTYFINISQSWLKRVLVADPAGVDPRQSSEKDPKVSSQLRKILETIQTFPVSEPPGICIQDLK